MSSDDRFRDYLFKYCYDGATWDIVIRAESLVDAKERLKALTGAQYQGEVAAKIPAVPGADLFVRAFTAVRNLFRPPIMR